MSNISSTSELTTKEIVEQAISDYHESILPYLNGMVPMIANKFDKSNLYSEDEQIVGRWIDGKPLYQKTVLCTTSDSITDGQQAINPTNHNIQNIDYIVDTHIHYNTEMVIWDTSRYFLAANTSSTSITLRCNRSILANTNFYVTIQYTKTTDEAIAIGSDTDYSTTEKIVGTWTDGKPLYQKTVPTGTAVPSSATEILRITNGQTGYDTIQYTKA